MLRRAGTVLLGACATVALTPPQALAQARGGAAEPDIAIRAVVEAGARTFSASHSFDAVLGTSSGPIFGAGAAAIIRRNVFVSFDVTRFQRDGERVVVAAGEAFPNGIATTISVVPIEISAGWRFTQARRTVIPYLGGGLGWHKYKETSDFADDGEDVQFTKIGFQLLGGAEWRASRWLGIAGEAAWMSVPDAFSNDTGAAAAFDEHDLGGAVFRVKVVIGR
jgi:hypothetical protein